MILFLDFDGVLHPTIKGEPDFCRIHLLWQILRACPDVDVVFSTSWKENYSMLELSTFVTQNGGEDLAHRFLGTTPSFLRERMTSYIWLRDYECLLWLWGNGHKYRDWLALDDRAYLFPKDSEMLYLLNPKIGLTNDDVNTIIEVLKCKK